jgi:hypothetical protein
MGDETTEHITLPDGRVVRLISMRQPEPPGTDGAPAPAEHRTDPHVCPSCAGELVFPVSWEERVDSRWKLSLRCPECEWRGMGEFDQPDVEKFDDALNDGTEQLLNSLRASSRANMEADIERFIGAMNDGVIEPMDF